MYLYNNTFLTSEQLMLREVPSSIIRSKLKTVSTRQAATEKLLRVRNRPSRGRKMFELRAMPE